MSRLKKKRKAESKQEKPWAFGGSIYFISLVLILTFALIFWVVITYYMGG